MIYAFSVFYRFGMSFGIGYLCCVYLAAILTSVFYGALPKAEAIFLAALLALVFYLVFVILIFCTHSLKKVFIYSVLPLASLFCFAHYLG